MKNGKMRALKYIYKLLALSLTVAACSSDTDNLKPDEDGEGVPLRILAGINVQAESLTRASETSWAENDQIGVYVTENNSTTIFTDMNGKALKNLKFTFNDGSNYETFVNSHHTYRLFTSGEDKVFLSADPVTVYGYYPYVNDLDMDPTAMPIDVGDQTSQEAIDFMWVKKGNVNNGTAAIELLFMHRLVKLVFNLKQGEGLLPNELNDATYLGMRLLGQKYLATYNIYKAEAENPFTVELASTKDITPKRMPSAPTGYVRTFEAIVLPNIVGNSATVTNNPAIDRTVEITFYRRTDDQIVNRFTIPAGTALKAGYKYTFNVTVNATTITVDPLKFAEQW